MMARINWRQDAPICLRLRDGLHTIGQLKELPFIWLFDIRSQTGKWEQVDLNSVKPLFCVMIGGSVRANLGQGRADAAPHAGLPVPDLWISPCEDFQAARAGGFLWRGGRLIKLDPRKSYTTAPVITECLSLEKDRAIIETCELVNMWGDQDLRDRLCRYFDTGINRDDLKFEIFPGLWNDRDRLKPLTRRLPARYR